MLNNHTGIEKEINNPSSITLSALISPLCNSIACFTIESPNPECS